MQHHKYSLTEIEGMMPWERTVYVSLLNQWIKEQEEKIKAQIIRENVVVDIKVLT